MSYQPLIMEMDVESVVARLREADAAQIKAWAKQFVQDHPDRDELIGVIGEKDMLAEAEAVITEWILRVQGQEADESLEEVLEETEFVDFEAAQILFGEHIRIVGAPMSIAWFHKDVLPLIDLAMPGFAAASEDHGGDLALEDGIGGCSISAASVKRFAEGMKDVDIDDPELYDYVLPYVGAVEAAAERGKGLVIHWF